MDTVASAIILGLAAEVWQRLQTTWNVAFLSKEKGISPLPPRCVSIMLWNSGGQVYAPSQVCRESTSRALRSWLCPGHNAIH